MLFLSSFCDIIYNYFNNRVLIHMSCYIVFKENTLNVINFNHTWSNEKGKF